MLEAAGSYLGPLHDQEQPRLSEEQTRKNYRNCCVALAKLAKFLTGSRCSAKRETTTADDRFLRLCEGASSSPPAPHASPAEDEDARSALSALRALALLAPLPADALRHAAGVAAAAARSVTSWPPHLVSGALWSAHRLHLDTSAPSLAPLEDAYKALALPFGVSHALLAQVAVADVTASSERAPAAAEYITLEVLRREIPFVRDKLVTRDGKVVDERRETCWMAEAGVGGLAYSGKIMAPVPMTANVAQVCMPCPPKDLSERAP